MQRFCLLGKVTLEGIMSRSYKKNPGHYDGSPFMKNQANRQVRHISKSDENLVDGKMYRKVMDPRNIKDQYWMAPKSFDDYVVHNKKFYSEITELIRQGLYRDWMKARTK
jgi:hypothetical protein